MKDLFRVGFSLTSVELLVNSSFLAILCFGVRGKMVGRGLQSESERFSFASATFLILMASRYFGWIRMFIDTFGWGFRR